MHAKKGKALKHEGYTNYHAMILMSDNDIETIAYYDDKTKQTVPLMKGFRALLQLLERYYKHREDIGDPIDIFEVTSWKSITSDDLIIFRHDSLSADILSPDRALL